MSAIDINSFDAKDTAVQLALWTEPGTTRASDQSLAARLATAPGRRLEAQWLLAFAVVAAPLLLLGRNAGA